jgi:hypothetical protein
MNLLITRLADLLAPECVAANGGGPSRLQSARLVAAVAELGSPGAAGGCSFDRGGRPIVAQDGLSLSRPLVDSELLLVLGQVALDLGYGLV